MTMCVSVWVTNAAYLFENSFLPLGSYQFSSTALSGREPGTPSSDLGNRFRGTWAGSVPVPFPKNYLLGIDHVRFEYERRYPSYLRGEFRLGGWWYYYLYAMVVKMPTGTAFLIIAAACLAMGSPVGPRDWKNSLCVLTPAVGIIMLVSSQTGFNHHIRYVLPAFPFLFIFAAGATRLMRSKRIFLRVLPMVCLGWMAMSSLWAYPHGLSYFTELSGGSKEGWRHLDFSNVDWGQDMFLLKEWSDARPEARPLYTNTAGILGPEIFDIPALTALPVPVPATGGREQSRFLPPGWYVLSVHRMIHQRAKFGTLIEQQPKSWIGYSMRVFHLREPFRVEP